MTTFQALIDAFVQALSHILPFPIQGPELFFESVLHWPSLLPEINALVCLMGSLCFLIFFRFDWLGIISAGIKSLMNPMSLKSETRTLDQHTFLFLILIFLPSALVNHFFSGALKDIEISGHPFVLAVLSAALAYGFYFSQGWNKRIHGLNHLKLSHGITIGILSLLSLHSGLPYLGLLWIGFALLNYHYEAVFKYSMLALGLTLFTTSFSLLREFGIKDAMATIGHLNSAAILIVSFSVFWMGLENLQKTLSESSYRTLCYLNGFFSIFFIAIYFLRN